MAALILAFAVSLVWCWMALSLGPRLGYVDRPGADPLKPHTREAVPLGGVGIFLGVHLAALMEDGLETGVVVASAIVLVLGLIDDRIGLAPVTRLGVETLAAVILVWAGSSDLLMSILGVLVVVTTINAVNLMDGLDGLAGSSAALSAAGLAVIALVGEAHTHPSAALVAALLGFLVLNWHPARVFLGDSGAYVVGMILASEIIRLSDHSPGRIFLVGAVLGVFLIDLAVTLVRRRMSGAPLFEGDRSHTYDRLRDRGWSVPATALAMAVLQTLFVAGVVGVATLA